MSIESISAAMANLPNEVYLGVYCLILLLQLFCGTINGIIIYYFIKLPVLRKNKHLRLVFFLSVGDFLLAVTELPYTIYMTANWNPTLLDFDPLYILVSSVPLPMQLKVSATITIALALNRSVALFSPGAYRKVDQGKYSSITLAIALSLAVFDVVMYFTFSPIERKPNCGTSGCFVGDTFRYYWGISNMILGLIAVILSAAIFYKIRLVSKRNSQSTRASNKDRFAQANRTSTGILISSLLFLTIPSVCVGVVELTGFSIFKLVGPFYSASVLSSGICNGIIFIGCNGDARRLVQKPSNQPAMSVAVSAWSTNKN